MSYPCQYWVVENNSRYEVHETWCLCIVNNKNMWCPHLTLIDKNNNRNYNYGFIRNRNTNKRIWKNGKNYPEWIKNILYNWEYLIFGDSYMLCKYSIYDP